MLVRFSRFNLLTEKDMLGTQSAPVSPPIAPANEDKRIPSRLITSKKTTEDVTSPEHNADYASMKKEPGLIDHAIHLARKYKILPKAKLAKTDASEHLIEHFKNNLLAIHDQMPAHIRERAKLWYDGAHDYTKKVAQNYGMHHASVAGVYAALSPQKDWYQNVSLGDRVIHSYHHNQDHPWTPEMEAKAKEKMGGNEESRGLHAAIKGKTLRELSASSAHQAAWIRMHDEAHNSPNYHILTPEGHKGETVMTSKGVPAKIGWQQNGAIAKAVDAIKADGSQKKISPLMGEMHKVRSFFNNIIAPNSKHGDVTVDTHAVAAAHYKPFSSTATEVYHNFKSTPIAEKKPKDFEGAKGSKMSGLKGTYPLYHEAYRRAAAERGIKPREMQSITWEGVRGTFPDTMKNPERLEKAHKHWEDHAAGKISAEEARSRVLNEFHGKMLHPTWYNGD